MTKIIILTIIYTTIFMHDIPKLKKKQRKTVIVYIAMISIAFYESLIYALDLKWIFIHDAVDAILGEPAGQIVKYLKVPPS
jgi:hypothetical protein